MADIRPWILRPPRAGAPGLRLFCLPHAGSGAGWYGGWSGGLGSEVEVIGLQPPGRENRIAEAPLRDMDSLVGAMSAAIEPMLAEAPYAVFGHSMGGHVAYELVCALRNRGAPLPCLLIVSGSRAPQLPPWSPLLYKMPDNALVRTLEERYGTRFEPGMLELVEMGLPTLRADLMVVETRSHRPAPLLPMPLLVLAGAADPGVPLADARAWARLAGDGCDVKVFSGGHFFPMMQRDAVLNCIRKALARIRQAAE